MLLNCYILTWHITYTCTPTFYTYYILQRFTHTIYSNACLLQNTQQTREYNYYFKHSTLKLVNWSICMHARVGVHMQEISLKSYLWSFYWILEHAGALGNVIQCFKFFHVCKEFYTLLASHFNSSIHRQYFLNTFFRSSMPFMWSSSGASRERSNTL